MRVRARECIYARMSCAYAYARMCSRAMCVRVRVRVCACACARAMCVRVRPAHLQHESASLDFTICLHLVAQVRVEHFLCTRNVLYTLLLLHVCARALACVRAFMRAFD
jgi:hypothetical protein